MQCAGMYSGDEPGMRTVFEGMQAPGIGAPRRHAEKKLFHPTGHATSAKLILTGRPGYQKS